MLDVGRVPESMRLKERGSLLTGLLAGLEDGEQAVEMCIRDSRNRPLWKREESGMQLQQDIQIQRGSHELL